MIIWFLHILPPLGMAWCRDSGVFLLRCVSGGSDGSSKLQPVQQQLLQVSVLTRIHVSSVSVSNHIIVLHLCALSQCGPVLLFYCRDCVALCCLNSATSIFAGFAVFSVLGFMAQDLGISMDEVAASGEITTHFITVCILYFNAATHVALQLWCWQQPTMSTRWHLLFTYSWVHLFSLYVCDVQHINNVFIYIFYRLPTYQPNYFFNILIVF